ncbi:MAG: hypothetical protein P8R54_19390 [Myxococcota bacterium]|nr:hypothetical protein [Myxococcota bacterium]
MSEENDETLETPETPEEDSEGKGTTIRSPSNPLSRPTDAVIRPGFRNPANSRTKAQRKKRKNKKRR